MHTKHLKSVFYFDRFVELVGSIFFKDYCTVDLICSYITLNKPFWASSHPTKSLSCHRTTVYIDDSDFIIEIFE